jgi:hypothetical protein
MNGDSRGRNPGHHQAVDPSTTDRTTVTRDEIRAVHRRSRIARLAERAMPLAIHYGPRPLLLVSLGELDARGRRVA